MKDADVRAVERTEVRDAIATCARAFFDDPLMNYFQPDLLRQHQRLLPGLFAAAIHDCARHGELWGAFVAGRPCGVAAWLPPGVRVPTRGSRAVDQSRRALPALVASRGRLRAAVRLLNDIASQHPKYPHWYLAVLGVDPSHQSRGLGRSLLDNVHERADGEALPCYLETQKPENLAYYRRFGYEVVDEVHSGDCPPIWTMERSPRR